MPNRALRTAASGMYAQQLKIEVIANNIANINTTSFKKNRAEFKDMMYQQVSANPQTENIPGIVENTTAKIQIGSGVKPSSSQKVFQQGDLQETGQQFDVAIYGEGFFQLRRPDGTYAYSRDGSFKVSGEGTLVTSDGLVLEPGISFNSDVTSLSISRDGVVSVKESTGDVIELGSIDLAKFVNPAGLLALGDNLFEETKESGVPLLGTPGSDGFGELHQGYLESSNVDIVEEMIAMIAAQRAYEINSKTVKSVEDMMSIANNLKQG